MTIAEYFECKGEARGEARGEVIAKEAIAKKMMDKGFEPADIREVTDLSDDELAKIA